jgi:hypothetical protein
MYLAEELSSGQRNKVVLSVLAYAVVSGALCNLVALVTGIQPTRICNTGS